MDGTLPCFSSFGTPFSVSLSRTWFLKEAVRFLHSSKNFKNKMKSPLKAERKIPLLTYAFLAFLTVATMGCSNTSLGKPIILFLFILILRLSELPNSGDLQVLQIDSCHDWRHLHPKQALHSSWLHCSSSYDFRPHFLHNRRSVRLAQVRHDRGDYSSPLYFIEPSLGGTHLRSALRRRRYRQCSGEDNEGVQSQQRGSRSL